MWKASNGRICQRNYVDQHVDDKLQQLQFAPAPCATTAPLYGACTSTYWHPAHASGNQSVWDDRPDKRAQLINTLLNRPEHAKFWALKLGRSVALSVKQIGAQRAQVSSLDRGRSGPQYAVRQFASSLLTASGSTMINPPANFYRTSANRDDAVETSA